MNLYGTQKLYLGHDDMGVTYAIGGWSFGRSGVDPITVDFTNANITGLQITFG